MVWFHGGGYAVGSGGSVRYDGSNLARKRDVVWSPHHRLTRFDSSICRASRAKFADSGNVGMLDIVAALDGCRQHRELWRRSPAT